MGVYYTFYLGDFPSRNADGSEFFIAKFDKFDEEEMKRQFEEVIKNQKWPHNARIVAVPDYAEHPRFAYSNGELERFYVE